MLFSAQIKAGRALIKMNQLELAKITGISISTIKYLESSEEAILKAKLETVKKIKDSLEEKGIKFLYPKEKNSIVGMGVRYLPSQNSENHLPKDK